MRRPAEVAPAGLRRAVEALPEEAREALRLIAFEGGAGGMTVELCHQRLNQVTGRRRRNVETVLEPLLAAGIVARRRENYRELYTLGAGLRPAVLAVLTEQLNRHLVLRGPVEEQTAAGPDLIWDVGRFLAFLRLEPLRLTQLGTVQRRQRERLVRRLVCARMPTVRVDGAAAADGPAHPCEGAAPGAEEGAPDTDPVEDLLALLLGFTTSARLAVRDGPHLRLGEGIEDWLERPYAAKLRELWTFHRDRYVVPRAELGVALAALLQPGLDPDAWIDLGALGALVAARRARPARGPAHAALERYLLRVLALGGMLALGRAHGRPVARLTGLGRAVLEGGNELAPESDPCMAAAADPAAGDRGAAPAGLATLWIQPTFEVLVMPETPPRTWWEFDLMAELEQAGSAMRYRLTRESMYRALSAGWDAARIESFLARHGKTGLPQNVSFTLREWAGRFGRTAFVSVLLLRCEAPETADAIAASPRTGPYVCERVSPRDLAVREDAEPAMRRALLEDGHLPLPGIRRVQPPGGDGPPA